MSLVWFEQLSNLLKKAIYEKVNLLILYENNEKNELFSTQPRSEILFDLESPFHEELLLWVSFDLNNSLTFRKKLYMKKLISDNSYENNERMNIFLQHKLDRKFFLI